MRVKGVLTVSVWIDDAESQEEVRSQLAWLGDHVASRGLLTSENSQATVDTFYVNVTTEEVK